jgi:hypothetical protein
VQITTGQGLGALNSGVSVTVFFTIP